jgi:hypothetical protein
MQIDLQLWRRTTQNRRVALSAMTFDASIEAASIFIKSASILKSA